MRRTPLHQQKRNRQTTAILIISSGMDKVIGTPGISENIIFYLCRLIIGLVYRSLPVFKQYLSFRLSRESI